MHMSVRTWWVNHYEEHGKVKKSGDCIDVTFRRNVAVSYTHLDVYKRQFQPLSLP